MSAQLKIKGFFNAYSAEALFQAFFISHSFIVISLEE